MTFEKMRFLNGQTALAGLVLDQSWIVPVQKKNSDCNQSVFFIEKNSVFLY